MFSHVLIIADIEGSSGCPDYEASSFLTAKWALACREMTRDVNAVAVALIEAGVPRVTVHDFHRTGYNLIKSRLDPRINLVQGYRRGPVPGLGHPRDAGAAFFLGMHAASGTDGFLAHTLTSRISRLSVNGRPMAEIELFAASLAPFGVRPLFFSGCPVACRQAREAISGIFVLPIVKTATGAVDAPDNWRQDLARAAVAALNDTSPEPYRPRGPFQATVQFRDGAGQARRIAQRWNLESSGNTITLNTDTTEALYATLIRICYLTPLTARYLPAGLLLYRVLGLMGSAWVNTRLRHSRKAGALSRFFR